MLFRSGQGTTIKIFLPRVSALSDEQTVFKPRHIKQAVGQKTILVVEDDNSVRSLVKRVLENSGYRVITASNGDEAVKECERNADKIDLLLTDVIMPRMNGRELTERIKKDHPQMHVLFMSGYTDNAIANHGVLESGVNFIGKPFAAADLSEKVQEILGSAPDRNENKIVIPPPPPETGKSFAQS